VRRACLDHVLVLGEGHLRRILREYMAYFNGTRPHQGLRQHVPNAVEASPSAEGRMPLSTRGGCIHAAPVLGGLHHAYERAA
jgi:hypothetical protein